MIATMAVFSIIAVVSVLVMFVYGDLEDQPLVRSKDDHEKD